MDKRDVIDRLRRFNRGREPERLRLKFDRTAENPFRFLRGSCHLFYEDWPRHTALDAAPAAWLCGDLHLENFGSYKGDNGLTYFDINDFDEAALAPVTWDLTRLITSLRLATEPLELAPGIRRRLEKACLQSYGTALAAGKARWIERAIATGLIGALLTKVGKRSRRDFLDSRSVLDGKHRKLRAINGKTLEITDKAERQRLDEFLQYFADHQHNPDFYRLLDAKRRIAGTGSLGLERFVLLVEGEGSPSKNRLLDLKEARPTALAPALRQKQPRWDNPAERTILLQDRLQAIPPALLHPVRFAGKSWVMRELQPSEDRVEFARAAHDAAALEDLVQHLGALAAWSHLRASGRQGAADADRLVAFGETKSWQGEVRDYAKIYAKLVKADWRAFKDAYRKGAFRKLLA